MSKRSLKLIDIHGSKYIPVPFYVVAEYNLSDTYKIAFDRTNPAELVVRIKRRDTT
jgi:hypothetical protein